MNVRRVQVESLDQFCIMAQRPVDAYILLDDGTARSSKRIQYRHNRNGRHWWMYEYGSATGLVIRNRTGLAWKLRTVTLVTADPLKCSAGARGLLEGAIHITKRVREPF